MTTGSVRTRPHAPVKSLARPVARATKIRKKLSAARASRDTRKPGGIELCEKKFAELFGAPTPKGKVLNLEGECVALHESIDAGWVLMQYPPSPSRMSWVYATHGLSQLTPKNQRARAGMELFIYWRWRDKAPAKILAQAARYILGGAEGIQPGQIFSAEAAVETGGMPFQHCVVCVPDENIPRRIQVPGAVIHTVLLIGVSEAEMQFALKVKPEIADGRLVLLEALKTGGVFPMTDPERMCLTRRRDFHRIWESAFRTVREKKV